MQDKISLIETKNLHQKPTQYNVRPSIKATVVKKEKDTNNSNFNTALKITVLNIYLKLVKKNHQ